MAAGYRPRGSRRQTIRRSRAGPVAWECVACKLGPDGLTRLGTIVDAMAESDHHIYLGEGVVAAVRYQDAEASGRSLVLRGDRGWRGGGGTSTTRGRARFLVGRSFTSFDHAGAT